VKLVRDSGRVLNGAPQFVGRPEGELHWQADVCGVRPSRTPGFSACQVLWLIAGRSASCAAVKGFDVGDVVAQVPWIACRMFALGLARRRFVVNFQHIKHYCLRKCNEAHRMCEVLTFGLDHE
jgi:hypothetical protein